VSYGDYILATGKERVGEAELVLGRFFYYRYFLGMSPILDLAAGRCWFTRQNMNDIRAVDLAHEVVAQYAALGVDITEGSAYAIPYPDEHFAAVFCCWLFEHLADPDRAMAEIGRVLKPGGMCFLVVPSERQLGRGFWDDYTHVRPYTKASLVQLSAANHFGDPHASHLPASRFGYRLVAVLGTAWAYRYLQFSDRILRRLGIVNRNMLTLQCYKRA
jgi:ubiquinone/menaquinone biosynthesis C-methylase UbiE